MGKPRNQFGRGIGTALLNHEIGPWAANALYARARLELELGRPKRAETLLRRYLERHPEGLNAADVRKLRARVEQ